MISLIVSFVIVVIAIMMVANQKQSLKKMQSDLRQSQEKTIQLEQKNEKSKDDLRKSKDELEREKTALRDARELNKKKLRRQANADLNLENSPSEAAMTNKAHDDSQKALLALEAQIDQLKKEQSHHEDDLKARWSDEWSKKEQDKNKEIVELQKKISTLEDEIKKQKRLMRPEGIKVDLKTMPDDAASEFARVFRKAEQHERLHGITRAKLHLAQEKFTDLQRRYFSVCRELAMSAGNQGDIEPAKARDIAEKLVSDHQNSPENTKSDVENNS